MNSRSEDHSGNRFWSVDMPVNHGGVPVGKCSVTISHPRFYHRNRDYRRFSKALLIISNIPTFIERRLRSVTGFRPRLTEAATVIINECTNSHGEAGNGPAVVSFPEGRATSLHVSVQGQAGLRSARPSSSSCIPGLARLAGPSWKKALSGSGPGRFRGLVDFFLRCSFHPDCRRGSDRRPR
jgi:hypothetical protein